MKQVVSYGETKNAYPWEHRQCSQNMSQFQVLHVFSTADIMGGLKGQYWKSLMTEMIIRKNSCGFQTVLVTVNVVNNVLHWSYMKQMICSELQRRTQIPNYWDYLTLAPEVASRNAKSLCVTVRESYPRDPIAFVTGEETKAWRAEATCKYVSDRKRWCLEIFQCKCSEM